MKNNNFECTVNIILIFILVLLFTNKNKTINNISNKMINGYMNTVLILLIITLILTENIKMGFYLTVIYLFLLIKNKKKLEFFNSNYGYSPLDCKTYGDSRKKTGSVFYPINSFN